MKRLVHSTVSVILTVTVIISSLATVGQAQVPHVIRGTVITTDGGEKVTLSTYDPISQIKTSVTEVNTAHDGTYELTYDFDEPDLYRVDFANQNVLLVIGAGQSDILLDVEGKSKGSVSIKGSPDSEKLQAYDAFRQESNGRLVKPTYTAMRAASKTEDTMAEIAAVEAYAEASEQHRVELLDFTEEHIGTSLALYGSVLRWTGDDETERLDGLVTAFEAVHPELRITQVMRDKVERFKKVAVGAITPAIHLPDTTGQMVKLEEIMGEYTLLDFWASWCGPCLLQIPDLHAAYDTYHDKGFEIIGVSVDKSGDRWKKSIDKYEMTWPQLSDLKGWASEAAADYNVTFIPFNMLIDAEGRIIAKNLHSKALQKQLSELLDK